jgi:hypothetical protein
MQIHMEGMQINQLQLTQKWEAFLEDWASLTKSATEVDYTQSRIHPKADVTYVWWWDLKGLHEAHVAND